MRHHRHDAWSLSHGERHQPCVKHKLIDLLTESSHPTRPPAPCPNQQPGRPSNSVFPPCIIAFPESERWYQHLRKRQKRIEYRRRERFVFLTKASKRHMLRSSGRIHHWLADFGVEVVAEGAWVQKLFKVETVQQIVGTHIAIGEVVVPVALEIANHQRLLGVNFR